MMRGTLTPNGDEEELADAVAVDVDVLQKLQAVGDEGRVRLGAVHRAAALDPAEVQRVSGLLRQNPGTAHRLHGEVGDAVAIVVAHAPERSGLFVVAAAAEPDLDGALVRRQIQPQVGDPGHAGVALAGRVMHQQFAAVPEGEVDQAVAVVVERIGGPGTVAPCESRGHAGADRHLDRRAQEPSARCRTIQ